MIGRDDLRIGDAERDRMAEALREHYAQGRLTREELDQRLDQTFAARTAGELARVAHDLPDVTGDRDGPSRPGGYGPYGPPWSHRHAPPYGPPRNHRHAPPWGHGHLAARRHHRHPPVPLVLLAALVVIAVMTGMAGPAVLFFVWLGAMVIGGAYHHHRRHHRTRV